MTRTNKCRQLLSMAVQAGAAFLIGAASAAAFCSWLWTAAWL